VRDELTIQTKSLLGPRNSGCPAITTPTIRRK
jgi:hypothetical protein